MTKPTALVLLVIVILPNKNTFPRLWVKEPGRKKMLLPQKCYLYPANI